MYVCILIGVATNERAFFVVYPSDAWNSSHLGTVRGASLRMVNEKMGRILNDDAEPMTLLIL